MKGYGGATSWLNLDEYPVRGNPQMMSSEKYFFFYCLHLPSPHEGFVYLDFESFKGFVGWSGWQAMDGWYYWAVPNGTIIF